MKEGGNYSGSEEFARSLEPHYDDSHWNAERSAQSNVKAHGRQGSVNGDQHDVSHHEPTARPHKTHNPHAKHRRTKFEVFSAVYLLLLFMIVFLVSAATNSNLFIVLVSFSPILFTIVVSLILYESHLNNKNIFWVIPLILVFIFHLLMTNAEGILKNIDVGVLSAVNLFGAYVYVIVLYFVLTHPEKDQIKMIVKQAPIPADLTQFIASIEDKSKALNFVIGRVYNAYHGGTRVLREKINMKQEWYDQFSQLPDDADKIDYPALLLLINTIENRLKQLEKTEAVVFGMAHKEFKNLVRNDNGSDRVIDVLAKNDKDPVKNYYDGALQFCGKVREFAHNRESIDVKNEFAGPKDEEAKAPRSSWTGNLLKK